MLSNVFFLRLPHSLLSLQSERERGREGQREGGTKGGREGGRERERECTYEREGAHKNQENTAWTIRGEVSKDKCSECIMGQINFLDSHTHISRRSVE